MQLDIKTLLHPRIQKHCEKRFDDGYFKDAAREAMIQVELALKEKSGEKLKYGVPFIKELFGKGKGIKLHVPFGDELQEKAESLFQGAFSYYRNYAAHDGSKIDKSASVRIMIIATELLDLLGASSLSFADVGGIEGLIKVGIFPDKDSISKLLTFLNGNWIPDDIFDGLYEDLFEKGFSEEQLFAVLDLGLAEYKTETYIPTFNEIKSNTVLADEISWFELTNLGKELVGSNQ